jgi:hypothetical protein
MNVLYFWEMSLDVDEESRLLQVISKSNSAKCPICGRVNVIDDKEDTCEHCYEVILEDDGYYFYFYPEL